MSDSSRDRFTCPQCGQSYWMFAGESVRCPHCGVESAGLDIAAYLDVNDVPDLLDQLTSAVPVDLAELRISQEIVELLPEELARSHIVVPIHGSGDVLTIAVTPDVAVDTLEKLRFVLNRDLRLVTASTAAIIETIDRIYGSR